MLRRPPRPKTRHKDVLLSRVPRWLAKALQNTSEFFQDRRGTFEKCLKVCHCRRVNRVPKLSLRKLGLDLIHEPATTLKCGGRTGSPNSGQRFLGHPLSVFEIGTTFSVPGRTFFDGHDPSLSMI
jgi:hypothetical protein